MRILRAPRRAVVDARTKRWAGGRLGAVDPGQGERRGMAGRPWNGCGLAAAVEAARPRGKGAHHNRAEEKQQTCWEQSGESL